jgi:hypothetical protein
MGGLDGLEIWSGVDNVAVSIVGRWDRSLSVSWKGFEARPVEWERIEIDSVRLLQLRMLDARNLVCLTQ